MRLVLDLIKAEQLGLFGRTAWKPAGKGWEMIPRGKHGGFRRRKAGGWEYQYPGDAAPRATPIKDEPAEVAQTSSTGRVYHGGLTMKGPHAPMFAIQKPEGSNDWYLNIAGGHGLPSTQAKFATLPRLLEALEGMVDREDWDDRSRQVLETLGLSSSGSKPGLAGEVPRATLQQTHRSVAKYSDLNKYGYQIVRWVDAKALAAAEAAGPEAEIPKGAEVYEYIPWKDKNRPRYTAVTREEQAAVHAKIAPGALLEQLPMLGGPGEKARPLHGDVRPPSLGADVKPEGESKQVRLRLGGSGKPPGASKPSMVPIPGDDRGGLMRANVPEDQVYYRYPKEAFASRLPTEEEFRQIQAATRLEDVLDEFQIAHAEMGQRPPDKHPEVERAFAEAARSGITLGNYLQHAAKGSALQQHLLDINPRAVLTRMSYKEVLASMGKSLSDDLPTVIKSMLGDEPRLVLDLEKARREDPHQLGMFGFGGSKPPGAGWMIIPSGKHGGYRRRSGDHYEYWYPEAAKVQERPEAGDPEDQPARLVVAVPVKEDREERRNEDEVTASMASEKTKGERRRANDKAVEIVQRALAAKRGLTDEEAVQVAAYSGKGGISSDLNQFYTRTDISSAMWDMMAVYQDHIENVLEPSCGTGVLLQTAPKEVKVKGVELDDTAATIAEVLHGHRHSVESKSFEQYTIEHLGSPPAFDAAIGNPPFCSRTGDIPLHKPEYKSADRYFIDTSIDHVKDGGTVCLIIHSGVLNNRAPGAQDFRARLLARCEVLDAFRLPDDVFAHVHSGIGADMLVLRKRPALVGETLVHAQADETLRATMEHLGAWDQAFVDGSYFDEHTDRVLGKALSKDETGWRATVVGDASTVAATLRRLTELNANPKNRGPASTPITIDHLASLDNEGIKGNILAAEAVLAKAAIPPVLGQVRQIAGSRYLFVGEPPKWTLAESVDDVSTILEKTGDAAVKDAHAIAVDIGELIKTRDSGDYYRARGQRRNIERRVKAWVLENGIPGSHRALGELSKSAPALLDFIACVDANSELSDLLSKDAAVVLKPSAVDKSDLESVSAYVARRNQGFVNLDDVQHNWEGWEGSDEADVRRRLLATGDYMLDASTRGTNKESPLQHVEDYLTGNLYEKLDAEVARREMVTGSEREQIDRQVQLIRQRLETKHRNLDDVPIQLRAFGWMPLDWFSRWLNTPDGMRTAGGWHGAPPKGQTLRLVREDGVYSLQNVDADGEVTRETSDKYDWLKYMNRLSLRREHCQDVEQHIEKAFNDWIKTSEIRSEAEELYNRTFCADFRRDYSGEPLDLEGLGKEITPHVFQNQAVRWAAETGRGILGQDVGLGKTFIAILLARLRKQQGTARRPMAVVPKSVATNWAEEVETLIPGSRVLVIGEHRIRTKATKAKAETEGRERGLSGAELDAWVEKNGWGTAPDDDMERNRKLAMVKQNEYDLIICTKPAFERIPLHHETIEKYEKEDFWYQRAGRIDQIVEGSKTQQTQDKRIERLKAAWASDKLQQKFKHTESMVYWEDLGIDTLIADEAHAYKNLYAARSRFGKNPKFLGGSGQSKQARKMQHMTHWVRETDPTHGVYFLTATPTKNSPLEVFNVLQHIAPDAFQSIGIQNSEEFIDRFCKLEGRLVLTPPGRNKEEKEEAKGKEREDEDETQFADEFEGAGNLEEAECVVGFQNLKELEGIMDKYMLLQTATDVGLKIPDSREAMHLVDMTAEQQAVYHDLRAEASQVDTREDPGAMFRMLDRMKKAAQDLGLFDPTIYADWYRKSPKYKACVEEAYRGAMERGGQIIFCDHNAAHERLKTMLVEKGLKPEEVGIVNAQVAADSEARQRIGNAFNRGEIKVVIGNTGTMGEGVNLQGKKHERGTTDIHHLDQPWDPGTLHQRNGRGVRQGNRAEQVQIHTYLAKGSFDGFRHSTLKGKERWLDKLRSGANELSNDMDGQNIDEAEMLAMLSDNPDAALAAIKEKRATAEGAWYARQAQESIDAFYNWQKKQARLEKFRGDPATRDRLASEADRLKRQLLRHELLPLEIKAVINSSDRSPTATLTYMTGEGEARRLAAAIIRPNTVIEEEGGTKLVITHVDLNERQVKARSWGQSYVHPIPLDQLSSRFKASTYTAEDELKEALRDNIDNSWKEPLVAVAHINEETLAKHKDLLETHVRDWHAKHHPGQEILVRAPTGDIKIEKVSEAGKAEIVFPWGSDREALVEALASHNVNPRIWSVWDNPIYRVGSSTFGMASSYQQATPFNAVVQEAERKWKLARPA